ncbi:MAG: DNA adenine methylase [Thermoguttaceae bacterium]
MTQAALFGDVALRVPRTQGIKYAGSKLKLLPQILELVTSTGSRTVFDGFSGSTRVSQMLAKAGFCVTSNDSAIWSQVLATCFLKNTRNPQSYQDLIEHLNGIPSVDGWFSEHYGGLPGRGSSVQTDGRKRPWQLHNTRKLDGIREEIDRLDLDEQSKAVSLTSLMLALDEVDSTLGHFSSYLADWSPRSYKKLHLRVPQLWVNKEKHTVLQADVFDAMHNRRFDIAYLDPPYGSNNDKMPPSRVRYNAYYHLWTTICLNDRPQLFGKARRRDDSSDAVSASVFEEFRRGDSGRFIAVEAIERLIQSVPARFVLLSYSSGGRATAEELAETVHCYGRLIKTVTIDHKKNVMSEMRWTQEWVREAEIPHREFLFLMEK